MTNIEQQARELLEEEMDKAPRVWEDCDYREECEKAAIRAIARALSDSDFCHQCEQDRPHWLELEKLLRHNSFGLTGSYAEIVAKLIHALTPTGENAKHVEVLRVMLNGDASRLNLQAYERIRALSAPDNAEGETIEELANRFIGDTGWMPDEWQDWRNEFHRDLRRAANPTPAARVNYFNAQQVAAEYGLDYNKFCAAHNAMIAAQAARVSGQDIDWCEDIARDVLDSTDAAAIRRLVQAVKGEK